MAWWQSNWEQIRNEEVADHGKEQCRAEVRDGQIGDCVVEDLVSNTSNITGKEDVRKCSSSDRENSNLISGSETGIINYGVIGLWIRIV